MIDCMDRRALERLGHHVVSRRVALGYRNRTDLADSLQFTVRTLADIEHGVRKASPGTYAMLENKLAWAPGSIDTILAGGEPKELVVKLRRTSPRPAIPQPDQPPTPSPAPPPRSCCWSCDAASSPPATDATRPGTTGTASTRTATGPTRASQRDGVAIMPLTDGSNGSLHEMKIARTHPGRHRDMLLCADGARCETGIGHRGTYSASFPHST